MAKKMPEPFEYRGGWRATVTLANGKRPVRDFAAGEYNRAVRWILPAPAPLLRTH